ncbi:MAG: hypothetical protein UY07_C0016G0019 [Parcubacteria group bacterium GW2011_GWA1_47_8]|nr:MAG: hypothetical protein UY07_C0016G0019 [Parcubacteria group bacterium GW2011_GWA1_47_8]KKW07715.1 MAG: hypothetical protein UY42_C0008G0018 [Parcubacteria group bacterium GW2011_GWA2_49_16]
MRKQQFSNQGGFLKIIGLIVVGVIILAYFNFDAHAFAENPFVKKIGSVLQAIWTWGKSLF